MEQNKEEIISAQKDFYRNRLLDKVKKHLLRIISGVIILLAVIMTLVKSVHFVRYTDIFNIKDVIVKGNQYVKYNDILEIMDLTGKTRNIFQVDLKEIKKKLEQHPRIKIVSVSRELPDHLVITILERRPVALINVRNTLGSSLYEVDEDGFLTSQDPYLSEYDLPIITSDDMKDVAVGQRLTDRNILHVLKALRDMDREIYNFNRLVAEINIRERNDEPEIIMYLNFYNVKILFGRNLDEAKLRKLNYLLIAIGEKVKDLEYIDFKFDEAVGKYRI